MASFLNRLLSILQCRVWLSCGPNGHFYSSYSRDFSVPSLAQWGLAASERIALYFIGGRSGRALHARTCSSAAKADHMCIPY